MNEQQTTTTATVALAPIESEKKHVLEEIFQAYVLWKSLPAMFKNPPVDRKTKTRLSVEEFLEAMGVTDESVIRLSKIRWQKDFADEFSVSQDTLVDWNKEIAERDPLEDIRLWASKLTKNVIASLYNKALRKGDSFEVKLFMQLVNKWNEKQIVEHDYKGVKSITYEIVEPNHERNTDQTENKPEASTGPKAV